MKLKGVELGYASYLAKRALLLAVALVIATYATVIIANFGGYIDLILKTQIEFEISQALARNPHFLALPEEERKAMRERLINEAITAAGLDKPFLERSLIYLKQALMLDLGRAITIRSAAGSSKVADIILERLPWSVLLFTTGTMATAAIGVPLGLYLGRKALSKLDRSITTFAILTEVVPPWFFGILAILIFSFYLGILPAGGIVSYPHEDPIIWTADFLRHLILPLSVWVFSFFGGWAYITRNLVIHILHEDYVMAARAKGLPEGLITRRYVLRPAAPPIVTMIALTLIGSWMGAIITETVFNWPGLGRLYYDAIWALDAPVVIGLTVVYAYLLVATVFILDLVYGILDPRIKVRR